MEKALQKRVFELYHYADEKRIEGKNPSLSGNCSWLTGNCTELSGDCTELSGNCSRLRGDCSGLTGNIDNCKISLEERKEGIDIKDLVI